MKKIFLLCISVLIFIPLRSQNYDALNSYMLKYGQASWIRGYLTREESRQTQFYEQIGHVMPNFHFNNKLNSKNLKGQFVVLNFWATWCSACRLLSCDIDSVIKHHPAMYNNVQVIGVDAHERSLKKEQEAEKWWTSKGISYPMVKGKAADACCESIRGTHPTVILIDEYGIIRGRWNGWNPTTAGLIDLAIWALKVLPEENIQANMENVKNYMTRQEYAKALYLLEMLPDTPDNSALRYICMLENKKNEQAESYFAELQKQYAVLQKGRTPCGEYAEILKTIAEHIYQSNVTEIGILKNGIDAFHVLSNIEVNRNSAYEKEGMLLIRYASECKKNGIWMLQDAFKNVQIEGDSTEIKRLEKLLEEYKKN
ncbi:MULTISPECIES: TlpA family protein disulfide reductase [Butyricimonas]|uniref:TlpA family protein disulfide reductase n=1 Tax=Butyricimonas TaxID=574697 RepID=UPI0007FB493C|nr:MULTISPECIES: TlpA disulfide reductase family protein [Butyricimonas]